MKYSVKMVVRHTVETGEAFLSSVGTVELGGDFVKTPIAIRERLLKIGPTGESIKTVLRDKNRRPVFTTL